jgi:hypothetical protein
MGSPQVEAGIDQNRATGLLLELLKDPMKPRVTFGVDRLYPRRIVHVGDRRDHGTKLLQLVDPAGAVLADRYPFVPSHRRDQQHVGTVLALPHFKVVLHPLAENGRRERPKGLPELDLEIHHRLHLGRSGVPDNRSVSEGPRPELHAAFHVAHDVLGGDERGDLLDELVLRRDVPVDRPTSVETGPDGIVRVGGSEKGASLMIALREGCARLVEELIPHESGGSEGAPGVTRGRLNPDAIERPFPQYPAVADAVQGDASSHYQVPSPGELVCVSRRSQHDLLGDFLNRGGDVHLALGERAFHRPGRPSEELVELLRGHDLVGTEREVRHVHPKRPVRTQIEHFVPYQVRVLRLPVRREAHELVFAAVHLETAEIREGGVKEPERVRESKLLQESDPVSLSDADAPRRPLADPVEGEDRGALEGRG